jgi:DNA relaxase NicK
MAPIITRLDFYYDDLERLIEPYEISELAEKGHYTGFRGHGNQNRFKFQKDRLVMTRDEVHFGGRGKYGSGAYIRIYDKALECIENGIKYDDKRFNTAIRYEVEISGDKAKIAFNQLLQFKGDTCLIAQYCGAVVAGSIDFLNKTDKNLSRCKRYMFWQAILDNIGRDAISLRPSRNPQSVEKTKQWHTDQVAPSMTMIRRIFGLHEYIHYCLQLSEHGTRLNPVHYKMIDDYAADKDIESLATRMRDFFKNNDIEFGFDIGEQNNAESL